MGMLGGVQHQVIRAVLPREYFKGIADNLVELAGDNLSNLSDVYAHTLLLQQNVLFR